MENIDKVKKEFKRAQEYSHNEACQKAGKELLRQATEEHLKRKSDGEKSTFNAALDAAHYLRNRAVGAVSVMGGYTYCCFDCLLHKQSIKDRGQVVCHNLCTNGEYFKKKGNN